MRMRPQRGCCSSHSPTHGGHRSDTGRKVDECEPVAAVGREEKDKANRLDQPIHPATRSPLAQLPPLFDPRATHLLFELGHALLQSLILSAQLVLLRLDREERTSGRSQPISSDRADPQPAFICSPPLPVPH
jgi:hypothetical protein